MIELVEPELPQSAVTMVSEFEGLSLVAYLCPANVWTIGYGKTGSMAKEGNTCTEEEAWAWLRGDLDGFGKQVLRVVKVPLNNQQYGALASFAYNIGMGAFRDSTLLKRLNTGDYDCVPEEMARWTKATVNGEKVELPGLVRRRAEEGLYWRCGRHEDGPEDMPQGGMEEDTGGERNVTIPAHLGDVHKSLLSAVSKLHDPKAYHLMVFDAVLKGSPVADGGEPERGTFTHHQEMQADDLAQLQYLVTGLVAQAQVGGNG